MIDLKKLVKENKELKKKKESKTILKGLKKKVQSKSILKKEQTQVTIPNYKAPSVWGDENRFFKGAMEETKRSMFFS